MQSSPYPTIYKYELSLMPGDSEFMLPGFVRWLDAGEQDGRLIAWAVVVDGAEEVRARISVRWTGHVLSPLPAGRFLRSVRVGDLVCHVFAGEVAP